MRRPHKTSLLRSLLIPAVLVLPSALAQTPSQPAAQASGASAVAPITSSPNLAQLHLLIDHGHPADALKQLDTLATQQPAPAGVNRSRGLALYSQNQFVEADAA